MTPPESALTALFRRAWDAQVGGDPAAAIAIYRQILAGDASPAEQGQAWLGLGQCQLDLKAPDQALEAFRRAAALLPDSGAIAHMVKMLEGGPAPDRAPDDYVLWVFDGHAASFDAHLAALGYRGPEMIARLAAEAWRPSADRAVLDLGCGTGLNAPLFRSYAARLDGLDLAPNMLRLAARRGYDHLYKAEIHTFLRRPPTRYDLLLATDVFIYIGRLEEMFYNSNHILNDGGGLLFTIELAAEGAPPVSLMPTGRFRQTDSYIRDCAARAGFTVGAWLDDTLRVEQDQPVAGRAYRLIRSGTAGKA
jgi:predicted TPR repeat methyltransferase